jgi:hypothetical protein
LVLEVVVLVVGLESLQEVRLLGVLPLVLNTGMGGPIALIWRGGTVHRLTPLSSKWLGTSFTPVLNRLFGHVLVFEFQVGDLKNI